jgi:hypothetical protein
MSRLLDSGWIRTGHRLSIAIPLTWWISCYTSWILKGCRPWLPYISEFDMWEPEDTIFTVGVCLTVAILSVRVLQIYAAQHLQLTVHQLDIRWRYLLHVTLMPALIGLLSAAGLAFAPWNEHIDLHRHLANGIFYCGVAWCISATTITWRLTRVLPQLRDGLRWRIAGSLVAACGLLGMTQTVGRVIDSPDYDQAARIQYTIESPMAYCSESYSALMDAGAAFEWVLILAILFVTWTFSSELHTARNQD